jgi:hypothetical protein
MANLEIVDKSLPTQPQPELEAGFKSTPGASSSRLRVSRLPPTPSIPSAGFSGPSRYMFVAVRSGHRAGVYTDWAEAEKQLIVSVEVVRVC